MAKSKTKDKLSALREKLAKTDMGGSSGFWSPEQGSNVVRILPEVGEMPYFYQEVGRHYFTSDKQVYCPRFTSDGELDCPVCELVSDLYKGDKASKALAGDLRVRKMFWMNIVVRDGKETKGPFIYTPGVTVMQAVSAYIQDPDYGDITDEEEGVDLVIEREGTGRETRYQVIARRKDSALADTDAAIDKIFNDAKDLSYVEVSEDPEEDKELSDGHAVWLLPYNRIVTEFDLDLDLDDFIEETFGEDDEEDSEDEEEVHPAKKEISKRRNRRKRRR